MATASANAYAPSLTHASNTAGAGAGAPASLTREAFLSYFFGQNGPGPVTGTSLDHRHHANHHRHGQLGNGVGERAQTVVPVGRDMSGASSALSTGLMAGKRIVDGNSAAYDMKSLGKHIEAVSRNLGFLDELDGRSSNE